MRTNSDGERYLEAISATAAGSGSVRPMILVNERLGGADSGYNSSTGAGQKGATHEDASFDSLSSRFGTST